MKIVLKGIVTREDAELARARGVDGIIVSNHGGRAEDSGRGAIESLREVVEGVRGAMPVLVDSGFRRGTDIFKALALGAQRRVYRAAIYLGSRRVRSGGRRRSAQHAASRARAGDATGGNAVARENRFELRHRPRPLVIKSSDPSRSHVRNHIVTLRRGAGRQRLLASDKHETCREVPPICSSDDSCGGRPRARLRIRLHQLEDREDVLGKRRRASPSPLAIRQR